MSDTNTDEQIVRQVQKGNKEAFRELVVRHQNAVFRTAYQMLGDHDYAQDASQETFFRAYKGIHTFRCESKFSTWLVSIAKKVCFEMLRKIIRNRNVISDSIESVLDKNPELVYELGERLSKHEEEMQERLVACYEQLNLEEKSVIRLHYWEGMLLDEIADESGVSYRTIRRIHKNALNNLCYCLSKKT